MCDCGALDLVTDHATGDTVCVQCGVVVEAHEMVHYDIAELAAAPPRQPDRKRPRVSRATTADDAHLAVERDVEDKIRACMNNLRISSTAVLHRAKELFNDVNEAKPVRGDDARLCFVAAAVYFACKMCGEAARELRLVAACGGVDAAALNAAVAAYKDRLEARPYYAKLFDAVSANRLINMYTDRLRVDDDVLRRIKRDAHALHTKLDGLLDCSRAPRTICGALTWLAVAQNRERARGVSKKDVAAACDVCIQSIDKCLTDIFDIDNSLRSHVKASS
jgi:transcription initiation factor TFIIIB Brf1 subunit/transcription initiation factor TFIIB